MTLSNWFRDYVFLPLEFATRGAGSPIVRISINVIVTMLLCGLWHGPRWNFVFWGALHGVALAVHRMWRAWKPESSSGMYPPLSWLGPLASRLLTLSIVMLGWVFFRAESWSVAMDYLGGLVRWRGGGLALESPFIIPLTAFVFVVHLVISKDRNWVEEMSLRPFPVRVAAYGTMLLLLTLLVPADTVPFVYSQF